MHLLPTMEKRSCVPALIFMLILLASSTQATFYDLFFRCPDPGVPKNGSRSGDYFGVGYSVEYDCDSNFTMIGAKRMTCMFMRFSVGWSSERPSCIAINNSTCGRPPRPSKNAVLVLESISATAVVYKCRNDNFIRTRGDRILTCSSNGNWTGSLLICRKKATCPLPEIVTNGGRQVKGTKEGDFVVFYCQPNYELVGERRANCTRAGLWSHPTPKCIRVCPDPGVPANSRKMYQNGNRPGSVVTYECLRGFKSTSGSLRRQCMDSGEWFPPAPVCKRVDCGLPRLPNGKATLNSTLFEANATLSCNIGFKLVGERHIRCLSSGLWSYTSRCDAIQCPLPSPIENGHVQQNSLNFGSEARYICNSGYFLIGSKNLTCSLNKTWVPEVPVCKIVDCGDLQPPRNGSVSIPFTRQNSIAEYECDDGFTLVGEKTRVCQKNSTWSGKPPLCIVMLSNCPSLRSPDKGNVQVNSTQVGSVAVYSCVLGYQLSTKSNMRQCLSTGNWSGDEPSCIKIQCPPLTNQPNGEVVVEQGRIARYTCNAGYDLVGRANRTCLQTGMWSGNPPVCTPVDCGDLTDPENGAVLVVNTTLGSEANYTCNGGFDINGDLTRVCQQDGEWSGNTPQCISSVVDVPDCGVLLPPVNGSVLLENITIGSVANYSCDQGFELLGVSSRTCQGDSTWSDRPPTCVAVVVDCGPLPKLENGQVEFNRTLRGAESNYSCNLGYILEGEMTRTCLSSGNWSGDIPMCIIVDCSLLRSISNGALQYINGSTTFRSQVEYTCNNGFELGSGDRIRTCLENGDWNGTEPICIGNTPAGRSIALSSSVTSSVIFSSTFDVSFSSILPTSTLVPIIASDIIPRTSSSFVISPTLTISTAGSSSILFPSFTPSTPAAGLPAIPASSSVLSSSFVLTSTRTTPAAISSVSDTVSFTPSTISSSIATSSSTRNVSATISPVPILTSTSTSTMPTSAVSFTPITISSSIATSSSSISPVPILTSTSTSAMPTPAVSFTPSTRSSSILTSSITPVSISTFSSASISFSATPSPSIVPTIPIPPVTCDDLPNPENGIVTVTNRSVGSMVRYDCNPGFTLRGERTRECNTNGTWTGEAPICIDNNSIDCGIPVVPTNGELTITTTTFRSTVRYSCRLPYRLIGNIERICQVDATWSGTVPQCILINCGDPEVPANGIVENSRTTFEAIARYTCVNGYNRIGTERRVCGRLGLWSGRVPRCQIVDCGSPGDFPNGIVIVPRTTFEGVATFFCDRDFRRVGDRRRVCQADGTWTGSVPICIDERPDCGDPGTPSNGGRTLDGTRRGDSVEYTCNTGFRLIGNAARECQQNGIWSGTLPTCNKITSCPALRVPANARRINGNFSVGMFVYFVCSDDYDLIGSNARECQVDGTWSGTQPECMFRDTDCNTSTRNVTIDTVGRRCICEDRQLMNCSRLREDWTTLSANRKAAYIQAVKTVTSNRLYVPRYRDLMQIFSDSADTLAQGRRAGTSLKFPWNRFFLREYEDLLRMIDPSITIPFWDWTISNTNPYRHPVFDPNNGFGNSSNAILNCVTSGPFSVDQFTVTPLAGGGCLTREYLQSTFLSRTGLTEVVLVHTAAQFNLFFQRIAFFPYLNVRCSVGGIICGDNGAEDPLYVLSAAFVDKVWDQWQGLSNDRLRARYADNNSSLPLTNFRVREYHDNSNLPFGVSVNYGPLVAIGSSGAGGASDHDGKGYNREYEDKDLLEYKESEGGLLQEGGFALKDEGDKPQDTSVYTCAMSEAVLERSRLTDEEKELYTAMCLKR